MKGIFKFLILISFFSLALLIAGRKVPALGQDDFAQANDYLLFVQITDEHIEPETPINLERLRSRLRSIRAIRPDVLISTGDHTTYDDAHSYNSYINAFGEVGVFTKFPFNGLPSGKIPFMPVAGNHDSWTYDVHSGDFRGILSYTVGNYRLVGFSNDIRIDFPISQLETEMKKSCADSKPLIIYHHYAPYNWMEEPLGIDQISWNKLDILMQKYPVILYLGGHSHDDRTQTIGSYIAHTGIRAALGFTGLVVKGNQVNFFGDTNSPVFLAIIQPFSYYEGLDYTKTRAEVMKVRVYARAAEGQIKQVYYSLDNGPAVIMNRIGMTDNYKADLDASALEGLHNLEVTAEHSYGRWATNTQEITVNFSESVPGKISPGCASLLPTATPTLTAPPWKPCSFCDASSDGRICRDDIELIVQCFAKNSPECLRYDLNNDNIVNIFDIVRCSGICYHCPVAP